MKKTLILSILLMLLAVPYTIEAGSKKSNKKLSTNPSAVKPAGQENELDNKLKQANLEIETIGKEEKKRIPNLMGKRILKILFLIEIAV